MPKCGHDLRDFHAEFMRNRLNVGCVKNSSNNHHHHNRNQNGNDCFSSQYLATNKYNNVLHTLVRVRFHICVHNQDVLHLCVPTLAPDCVIYSGRFILPAIGNMGGREMNESEQQHPKKK